MQSDMHYHGTWCMARAAGMTPEAATIAATAAQFVDDNANSREVVNAKGERVLAPATAHHTANLANLVREDQWHVWVPFHFLPGNEGNSVSERLRCVMNSPAIHSVIDHHLQLAGEDFGLPLIGITAHVYADTFAHYGFSGLDSPANFIVNDSMELENVNANIKPHIKAKAKKFKEQHKKEAKQLRRPDNYGVMDWVRDKFLSSTAERLSHGLGHGAVLTHPDRPYLEWSYQYEGDNEGLQYRDNKGTFMAGCEGLYTLFGRYLEASAGREVPPLVSFENMRPTIERILAYQGEKAERAQQWIDAARDGSLFGHAETIPAYDPEPWLQRTPPPEALGFYQGAAVHRHYVFHDLLTDQGLCNYCESCTL